VPFKGFGGEGRERDRKKERERGKDWGGGRRQEGRTSRLHRDGRLTNKK